MHTLCSSSCRSPCLWITIYFCLWYLFVIHPHSCVLMQPFFVFSSLHLWIRIFTLCKVNFSLYTHTLVCVMTSIMSVYIPIFVNYNIHSSPHFYVHLTFVYHDIHSVLHPFYVCLSSHRCVMCTFKLTWLKCITQTKQTTLLSVL